MAEVGLKQDELEFERKLYDSYLQGRMPEELQAEYEQDILEGNVNLPQGGKLKKSFGMINKDLLNAYQQGLMTTEERIELEKDINQGFFDLPEGVELGTTEPLGFFEKIKVAFTGEEKETADTRASEDWFALPELNELNMETIKTTLGTILTNPDETAKILKTQFPNLEVRQDEKRNYIFKSSVDGKDYSLKPGFQISDLLRGGAGMAQFTPAGMLSPTKLIPQALGAAATQAGVEATQALTGGEFDVEQVPLAGLTAGAGVAGGKLLGGLKRQYGKFMRPKVTGEVAEEIIEEVPMTTSELTETARKAATGDEAKLVLGKQAAPDPEIMEAAKRLEIDEYLQPDHVTTNQSFRELSQAIKSFPGSKARAVEMEGLQKVAQKADEIIEEIGGTTDLSQLDVNVRNSLSKVQSDLDNQAEKLYKTLNESIPSKTEVSADNLLSFINNKADELGGVEFLDPIEEKLLKQLDPNTKPTYARLDNIRKQMTAARVKNQGQFKDANSGLLKRLENELLEDQKVVAENLGVLEDFDNARRAVAVRKGVEDDMKALFGKNLDRSIIGDLTKATKKISKGDASDFVKLIKAIPAENRQEVVASGLNTAFGKNARNGSLNFNSFTNWYKGLKDNSQAYTALMSNLPKEARKQLDDLYKISDGIQKASKERIVTGRLQTVSDELKGADSLIGNIYDLAKRSAKGAAAELVTTPLGAPGVGLTAGLTSALTKGKANTVKLADELISSNEFRDFAIKQTPEAAKRLSKSTLFNRFYKSLGKLKPQIKADKFLINSLQVTRQQDNE